MGAGLQFKIAVAWVGIEIASVGAGQTFDIKGSCLILHPAVPVVYAESVHRVEGFVFKHIHNTEYIKTPEHKIDIAFIEPLVVVLCVKSAYHGDTANILSGTAVLFHEVFLPCSSAYVHRKGRYLCKALYKWLFFDLTVPYKRFISCIFQNGADVFKFKGFVVDYPRKIIFCPGYLGVDKQYFSVIHRYHSSAFSAR